LTNGRRLRQHSAPLAATAALLLAAPGAIAQAVDSGALQRQQQAQPQSQPPATPLPPPTPPRLLIPEPPAATPAAGPATKIYVSRFKLSGPSALIDETELNTLLSDLKGRDDTFADIEKAASRIADALRKRGFAFVRVLVPQQEVKDGVVSLEIVPGRLSTLPGGGPDITVNKHDKVRLDDARAKAMVGAALTLPAALTVTEIERGLLLVNSLPGVQANGALFPGVQPNSLGLALDVHEGPLLAGDIDLDDYGSRETGLDRVVADLRLNDPSGIGDQGELNVAKATGTTSATASYGAPIGVSGLRTHVLASFMDYHLLDKFSVLDAKGDSAWYSAGLNYPQWRTQQVNYTWTGSVDFKQLHDSSAGVQTTSRRSVAVTGGGQGNVQFADNSQYVDYALTLTVGNLDRGGNAADLAVDQLTRRTQGDYEILRGNGSWLQQVTSLFSLSAVAQGQFSSRNLDSSEKLYLGGPRGVRAYPIEEAGSDCGEIISLEARFAALRTPNEDWTVFGLFDAAHADLNRHVWADWNAGNPNLRDQYVIKGYGIGVRARVGRRVQLEFIDARKLGRNPGASTTGQDADGRALNNRIWFMASVSF
jgi:hemolysin activation/secretion protein